MNTSDHLGLVSPKGGPAGEEKVQKTLSQVRMGKEEAELGSLPYFSTCQGSIPTGKGSNFVENIQICRAQLYVATFVRDRKIEMGRDGSPDHKQNQIAAILPGGAPDPGCSSVSFPGSD